MLERLTFLILLSALFLMSADSPRAGEEERRIWTPVVFGMSTLVLLVRFPVLLRVETRLLRSPACLTFLGYLVWITLCQFWSINAPEGRNHVLMLWIVFLAILSCAPHRVYHTATDYAVICSGVILASWLVFGAGFRWALSDSEFWRLKGIMAHEQTLALTCITGVILIVVWMLNRRRCELQDHHMKVALFVLAALATIIAAKARSFSVFFLITMAAIVFVHARGNKRVGILFAFLVGGGVLGVAIEIILPLFERSQQDATLSGRTVVWAMTWDEIQNRVILGHGFATYPDHFKLLWNNWYPAHAHNLWLQVWFENGLVGLLIMCAFLIALVQQGVRFQRQTGLLSYTLFVTVFLMLASIMAVVIGAKLTTPYGILLLIAMQEELLRNEATDVVARPMSPTMPCDAPDVEQPADASQLVEQT